MMWQYIIVGIILIIAISYACYSIWQSLSQRNNPCRECKGCALRNQMKNKKNSKHPTHCPKGSER